MTPTPSEPGDAGGAVALRGLRDALLADTELVGAELRAALADGYERWLAPRLPDRAGVALVAVGGLGRREPAPFSDLDLVLVHEGRATDVAGLAESIWYPVWDAGLALDHAVRTPDEALAVARTDLPAMLGMLDARHVAGDPALAAQLRDRVRELWRTSALRRAGELRELSQQRWERAGDGAFLLEPDLKHSRGGLRDGHALQALALGQLVDVRAPVREAYGVLLDVRGELHRLAGRADDVLRGQEHGAVAAALGVVAGDGEPTADELLRRVHLAARTIAHATDEALRSISVRTAVQRPRLRLFGASVSGGPMREPLARDVVAQDGEVVLARAARPDADAGLLLRAARAAAENALQLAAFTLDRLCTEAAPLTVPWPAAARQDFLALLGAGTRAVPVLESLDLAGLLAPLIPGWNAVRGRAQHNPVHRYTVDRHLLETAAAAARHTREVARPDLLLVSALLHDIGKGCQGDHSIAGAHLAGAAAARMGFTPDETGVITLLVRRHLLLADTATRRDLADPKTITAVAELLDGSTELLDLLHALTVADAQATGPGAWSGWKAGLVAELVHCVRAVLRGAPPSALPALDAERRALADAGELAVLVRDGEVVVAAPDVIGALYRTAGVLALHGLDVRSASIHTRAGTAVSTFAIQARFGRLPDAALVRADLARTLGGANDLAERLREKERAYARRARPSTAPSLRWLDDAATDATVLEVRAEDSIGLLCRLAAALERCRLNVRSARISSFGNSVLDAFYLTARDGRPVPGAVRADVELEMRHV